jgi:hypothetical protein
VDEGDGLQMVDKEGQEGRERLLDDRFPELFDGQ